MDQHGRVAPRDSLEKSDDEQCACIEGGELRRTLDVIIPESGLLLTERLECFCEASYLGDQDSSVSNVPVFDPGWRHGLFYLRGVLGQLLILCLYFPEFVCYPLAEIDDRAVISEDDQLFTCKLLAVNHLVLDCLVMYEISLELFSLSMHLEGLFKSFSVFKD